MSCLEMCAGFEDGFLGLRQMVCFLSRWNSYELTNRMCDDIRGVSESKGVINLRLGFHCVCSF